MNKDHKLALEDFLVVYGKVPKTKDIGNIKLLSIEKDHIMLQFRHKQLELDITKPIALDPPLSGSDEARDRLVKMAKYAASERGFSHVQIQEFVYPSIIGWVLIAAIHLPTLLYFKRDLLAIFPLPHSVAELVASDKVLISIIIAVAACHLIEHWTLMRPRLKNHRVPNDYVVEWSFFGFIEGYTAIKRFDDLVRVHTNR